MPATPSPAASDPHVRRWIARHLAALPPRAPSLIITAWGDAVAPHGGAAMLPGVIRLLAPFGLSERRVRTSMFRLARQGWLETAPVGRRSQYALTPGGAQRFAVAHARIYGYPADAWDDTWELLLTHRLDARQRRLAATELHWAGYGDFGPGVFARPRRAGNAVPALLRSAPYNEAIVAARATDDATLGGRTLAAASEEAWDLRGVAALYRQLIHRFGTVIERFRASPADAHHPEQCFVVRTLLVHDYRRALLRDPQLPAALLPLDWPGPAAYALCRDFYRLAHRAAEAHLQSTLERADGALPPAIASFYRRFDGLPRASGA